MKWKKEQLKFNINHILQKYDNYLRNKDFRPSGVLRYLISVRIYLNEYKKVKPSTDDAFSFRANLLNSNRKRSTINLYSAAIIQFHEMFGEDLKLPYLKLNNRIPYYLTSEDILRIFSVNK